MHGAMDIETDLSADVLHASQSDDDVVEQPPNNASPAAMVLIEVNAFKFIGVFGFCSLH